MTSIGIAIVAISLCVFATACAGAGPTGPTSSVRRFGGASVARDGSGGTAVTQAQAGSELPFKGTYDCLKPNPCDATTVSHHSGCRQASHSLSADPPQSKRG